MRQKIKDGRPSKYNPSMCEIALEMMQNGASKVQVAAALGISKETFYQWINKDSDVFKQEFHDAIKMGSTKSQAWWEDQGIKGIWAGNKFNATAYIYQMKCRFPEDYKENAQGETQQAGFNVGKEE